MPSLRELQKGFADAILGTSGPSPAIRIAESADAAARIAIYRNNIYGNYLNALGATYPVIRATLGMREFSALVDAYVQSHPSASGDLNVYGDAFGDFLEEHPTDPDLPWLADMARLEWTIDQVHRAPDMSPDADAVLAALRAIPAERLADLRFHLQPSCRLVASTYPLLALWLAAQAGHKDVLRPPLDSPGDGLIVRRDKDGVPIERLSPGDFAWLVALASGSTLGVAVDEATAADASFDLGAALRTHIASGIIAAVIEA